MPAISPTQYCCSVDLGGKQSKTGYISASKKKSRKLGARLSQVVFVHMWGEQFLHHLGIVCLDSSWVSCSCMLDMIKTLRLQL